MLILFLQRALSACRSHTADARNHVSMFVLGTHPVAVNLIPAPWDKLVHGGIFALLTCGIGLASGLEGRRMLVVAATTALLVGVLYEWHQVYLPGRQATWGDLAAEM